MRKYFVHYLSDGEDIKAVIEADSYRAAVTQIRKINKAATIYSIEDVTVQKTPSLKSISIGKEV